jgi:hypothetical protein
MLFKFWDYFLKSDFFLTGGGSPSAYSIEKSLRFRSASSAYLNRTNTAAGSQTTFTMSMWVKRSTLTSTRTLVSYSNGSNTSFGVSFTATDELELFNFTSAYTIRKITTAKYRDPSAWYHLLFTIDTTNATAEDRNRIYVNGQRITAFGTSTNASASLAVNFNSNGLPQSIGREHTGVQYFDGYMAEFHFIDGQALTPSSFGETSTTSGAWVPKTYTGSYGTNGFYLGFDDGTSTTTLGNDQSVNNNNWTLNNISLTAGVTYDWMSDTPSNNYPTLNPLSNAVAPANANLSMNTSSASYNGGSTFVMPSGKWYWECTQTSGSVFMMVGVVRTGGVLGTPFWQTSTGYAYYLNNGQKFNNSAGSAYSTAGALNDIIGVAFDATLGTLEFYKNNVSMGVAYTGLTQGDYTPAIGNGSGVAHINNINFGQRPFTYTPPTGFVALCTQNLPTPTIKRGDDYFKPLARTGAAAPQTVTGYRFAPNMVWMKCRSQAYGSGLYDSVRGTGTTKSLATASPNAEGSFSTNLNLSAFTSDGYTLGVTSSTNTLTQAANTWADWAWKESAISGFDIVTYTGTGVNRTVSHSLGVVPKMMIVKDLSTSSFNWAVYHESLGNTSYLFLNTTAAAAAAVTVWNNTTPTTTEFTVGTAGNVNTNTSNYVAYLFAEVPGFSKISSYTGNGSADGPFVYCGFRPAWVMMKRIDTADANGHWIIKDTLRAANYNVQDGNLYANLTIAEDVTSTVYMDILSNGFKLRGTYTGVNATGGTYIFMAFAENPFKYANAR